MNTITNQYPPVWRRLMSQLYDIILLFSIGFVATAFWLMTIALFFPNYPNWALQLYLLIVVFFWFGWCWTHGGQTLGAKSWRLRVSNKQGQPLNWSQSLKRFCISLICLLPFGLGLWSAYLRKDKQTIYDRWSDTQLTLEKKVKKPKKSKK